MTQSPAISLSLCMICLNEEEVLADALASAEPHVNEMIVVDTGSSDASGEIVRRVKTARLLQYDWCDDFAAAKNVAIENASGDYIIFLDADERLDSHFGETLRQVIQHNKTHAELVGGVRIPIWNYSINSSELGWKPTPDGVMDTFPYPGLIETRLCRLFRRTPSIRYQGRVHELIEPAIESTRLPILETPIPIHHIGKIRETEPKRYQARYEKYARIHKRKVAENPTSAKAHFELGVTYMMQKRWSEAQTALEQAHTLAPHMIEAVKHLIVVELKQGYASAAVELSVQLCADHPTDAESFVLRGIALLESGEAPEAKQALEEALNLDPTSFKALIAAAEIALSESRLEEARQLLHRAEVLFPQSSVVRLNLGLLALKEGDLESGIGRLKHLTADLRSGETPQNSISPGRVEFEIGKALIKAGRLEEAVGTLEHAHNENGRNADICLSLATAYQLLQNPERSAVFINKAAALNPAYARLKGSIAKGK